MKTFFIRVSVTRWSDWKSPNIFKSCSKSRLSRSYFKNGRCFKIALPKCHQIYGLLLYENWPKNFKKSHNLVTPIRLNHGEKKLFSKKIGITDVSLYKNIRQKNLVENYDISSDLFDEDQKSDISSLKLDSLYRASPLEKIGNKIDYSKKS